MREKGVPFTAEVPDGMASGRTDGPFVAANPRAEVPVLADGETRIFESTIIMDYIEDRWPDPPLLPRSPEARAAARIIEDVCDTRYEAVTGDFAKCCGLGGRRASSPKRAGRGGAADHRVTGLACRTSGRRPLVRRRNIRTGACGGGADGP